MADNAKQMMHKVQWNFEFFNKSFKTKTPVWRIEVNQYFFAKWNI